MLHSVFLWRPQLKYMYQNNQMANSWWERHTPFFLPILLNMAILQSRIIIINLEIEGLTYEKEIQKKYWIFTVVTLKDLSGIVLFLWRNIIIIWIFVWQCLSKVGFRIWNLKEKTATNKNIWFDCQYSSR